MKIQNHAYREDDDSTYKEDEVVTVNVNEHEPREALRLLKVQLKNFSGISCKVLNPSLKSFFVLKETNLD